MSNPSFKFLVVDNFSNIRSIIRDILHDMGHPHVHVAKDGETALDMLKSINYDFIVADVTLSGMSGLDLLKAIKGDDARKHIPVLMVTADNSKEIILEAAKLGAAGYILKPFSINVFMDRVAQIMAPQPETA